MPHIRKRGDTFQITIGLGYDENYKQRKKTLTFKPPKGTSAKQAEKLAQQAAYEFEIKCKGLTEYNENMTFRQLCEWFFVSVAPNKIRNITTKGDKHLLETHVFPEFGNAKLREITPAKLDTFFCELKKKTNPQQFFKLKANYNFDDEQIFAVVQATKMAMFTARKCANFENVYVKTAEKFSKHFNKKLDTMFDPVSNCELSVAMVSSVGGAMSSIFSSAVKAEIVKENPIKRTTPPKNTSIAVKEQAYLDEKHAQEFFELLDRETMATEKVALFTLLFVGLRAGELPALRWSDFDFEREIFARSLYFAPLTAREFTNAHQRYKVNSNFKKFI